MSKPITALSRKKRRVALLYELDFVPRQTLLRVDLIIDDPDGILTPVTPLYSARFLPASPVSAIPRRDFEPRKVITCSVVGDRAVTRRVFIPYRPIDVNHDLLICEVLGVVYVKNGEYIGEIQQELIERLIVL